MVDALTGESGAPGTPEALLALGGDRSLERRGGLPLAWLRGVVALAFPSSCLLCRASLEEPFDGPLCAACLDGLPVLSGPSCPRCALPYEASVVPGLCGPCRSAGRVFRRARALHPFTDPVRECVHALKYGGRRRVGRLLGRRAGVMWRAQSPSPPAAVVAVPLSPRRRRERGYNQAEVIARAVSASIGAPYVKGALLRVRERPPQAGLTAGQRRRNVAGVFRAPAGAMSVASKTVLLVDDVLTTGATADAAAACLLESGAEAVDVLTLARVS